ncbi:MAG TPA: hypothetical protein VFD11_00050 [Thiopseudomonas sp.]|nr:hypothetical protein [Thiopseudomonas sp.]
MNAPLTTQQNHTVTSDEVSEVAQLQSQLQQFTRLSEQFAGSLQSMQSRYAQVQDELAQVSEQRLHELAEKERLAQRLQQILDVLPGALRLRQFTGIRLCEAVGRGSPWLRLPASN